MTDVAAALMTVANGSLGDGDEAEGCIQAQECREEREVIISRMHERADQHCWWCDASSYGHLPTTGRWFHEGLRHVVGRGDS